MNIIVLFTGIILLLHLNLTLAFPKEYAQNTGVVEAYAGPVASSSNTNNVQTWPAYSTASSTSYSNGNQAESFSNTATTDPLNANWYTNNAVVTNNANPGQSTAAKSQTITPWTYNTNYNNGINNQAASISSTATTDPFNANWYTNNAVVTNNANSGQSTAAKSQTITPWTYNTNYNNGINNQAGTAANSYGGYSYATAGNSPAYASSWNNGNYGTQNNGNNYHNNEYSQEYANMGYQTNAMTNRGYTNQVAPTYQGWSTNVAGSTESSVQTANTGLIQSNNVDYSSAVSTASAYQGWSQGFPESAPPAEEEDVYEVWHEDGSVEYIRGYEKMLQKYPDYVLLSNPEVMPQAKSLVNTEPTNLNTNLPITNYETLNSESTNTLSQVEGTTSTNLVQNSFTDITLTTSNNLPSTGTPQSLANIAPVPQSVAATIASSNAQAPMSSTIEYPIPINNNDNLSNPIKPTPLTPLITDTSTFSPETYKLGQTHYTTTTSNYNSNKNGATLLNTDSSITTIINDPNQTIQPDSVSSTNTLLRSDSSSTTIQSPAEKAMTKNNSNLKGTAILTDSNNNINSNLSNNKVPFTQTNSANVDNATPLNEKDKIETQLPATSLSAIITKINDKITDSFPIKESKPILDVSNKPNDNTARPTTTSSSNLSENENKKESVLPFTENRHIQKSAQAFGNSYTRGKLDSVLETNGDTTEFGVNYELDSLEKEFIEFAKNNPHIPTYETDEISNKESRQNTILPNQDSKGEKTSKSNNVIRETRKQDKNSEISLNIKESRKDTIASTEGSKAEIISKSISQNEKDAQERLKSSIEKSEVDTIVSSQFKKHEKVSESNIENRESKTEDILDKKDNKDKTLAINQNSLKVIQSESAIKYKENKNSKKNEIFAKSNAEVSENYSNASNLDDGKKSTLKNRSHNGDNITHKTGESEKNLTSSSMKNSEGDINDSKIQQKETRKESETFTTPKTLEKKSTSKIKVKNAENINNKESKSQTQDEKEVQTESNNLTSSSTNKLVKDSTSETRLQNPEEVKEEVVGLIGSNTNESKKESTYKTRLENVEEASRKDINLPGDSLSQDKSEENKEKLNSTSKENSEKDNNESKSQQEKVYKKSHSFTSGNTNESRKYSTSKIEIRNAEDINGEYINCHKTQEEEEVKTVSENFTSDIMDESEDDYTFVTLIENAKETKGENTKENNDNKTQDKSEKSNSTENFQDIKEEDISKSENCSSSDSEYVFDSKHSESNNNISSESTEYESTSENENINSDEIKTNESDNQQEQSNNVENIREEDQFTDETNKCELIAFREADTSELVVDEEVDEESEQTGDNIIEMLQYFNGNKPLVWFKTRDTEFLQQLLNKEGWDYIHFFNIKSSDEKTT